MIQEDNPIFAKHLQNLKKTDVRKARKPEGKPMCVCQKACKPQKAMLFAKTVQTLGKPVR